MRRALQAVLAAALALAGALPALAAAPGATSSAVTVKGSGQFSALQVTVSKTKALRDEVVQVSWTGAAPTRGTFAVDYLQVFQCWGDDAKGPDRTQCQFGGLTGDSRGGAQVASRQVTYDVRDPLETLTSTGGSLRYVPFRSVTGKTREGGLSEFFDATTTNEQPFVRTRADGGGTVPFEVQTGVEAPGLGCGAPTARGPRRCWLVVVPRGETEVDGSTRTEDATGQLFSSPLSAGNWQHRLVVPLQFAAVGQPCPVGRAERPVVGQEQAGEAISNWQPRLCAGNGPVYSFSQVSDSVARRQVLSDSPPLAVTTRPLEAAPAGRRAVYAPLAVTGLSLAFDIESQSRYDAPQQVRAQDGEPVPALDLTPRLVAKLLTQSYRLGAATQDRAGLGANPLDLTRDPDFLRSNPAFTKLSFTGIPDVLVPAGLSDAGGLVWQWLLADPEAKAFLGGAPDPDGMVVNPAYKGATQQDGFPKADQVCKTFLTGQPPLCTLDYRPYASDTHEAARAAARGDTLARSTYDATALPPVYRKAAPQPTGKRAVIALTDAATAARYGLVPARLRNAAGRFVAPDDAGLLAGLRAMRRSVVDGRPVLVPDPANRVPAAYPLTTISYAVALPSALPAALRTDYASFLRFAAGPGQTPGREVGQLPPGYLPLPAQLRAETVTAAALVASGAGGSTAAPQPSGGSAPAGGTGGTSGTGGTGGSPLGTGAASSTDPAASGTSGTGSAAPSAGGPAAPAVPTAAAGTPAASASAGPAPVVALVGPTPVALRTPRDDVGVGRLVPLLALLAGGAAVAGSAWLRRTARLRPLP